VRDVVYLSYEGRSLPAEIGRRVLDVILEAGIEHRHVCGGHGFCTSCRIEVLDGGRGLSPVSGLERERLGSDAGRLRLACQTRVTESASVRVAHAVSNRFSPDGE
jgi:ferredoxin